MTRPVPLLRCAAACLFVALVALVALWLLFVSGCSTLRIDPPLHVVGDAITALRDARAVAAKTGGMVYTVLDTHSMEPLLYGGDLETTSPVDFAELLLGNVIVYQAEWADFDDPLVTHRLVQKTPTGWILSGDNNAHSEARWRVTAANYVGLVVGIWRISPRKPL